MVKQKFARGRIDLYIPRQEIGNMKIKINKNLAREYYDALLEVKDELDIHDDIKCNSWRSDIIELLGFC